MVDLRVGHFGSKARNQVGGRLLQVNAVAVADVHEPHDAQSGESLADRSPTYAEPLRELTLRHKPVSRLEVVPVDEFPQPLGHLLIKRAARDPLER